MITIPINNYFKLVCLPLSKVSDCKIDNFWNNQYYCSECREGFYLMNANTIIKDLYSNCSQCNSENQYKWEKVCLECSQRLLNCENCNSSNNCSKCKIGFFLRRSDLENTFCDPCLSGGKIEGFKK